MATLASRGRGASLQAGPYGSLPGASVPSVSQVGGQAGGSLRLGDVVLLYAQDKKSYVFSDISRYRHCNDRLTRWSVALFLSC